MNTVQFKEQGFLFCGARREGETSVIRFLSHLVEGFTFMTQLEGGEEKKKRARNVILL